MLTRSQWYALNTATVLIGIAISLGLGSVINRARLPGWLAWLVEFVAAGLLITVFAWSSLNYREYLATRRGEPLPPRAVPRRLPLGLPLRVLLTAFGSAAFFLAAGAESVGGVSVWGLTGAVLFFMGLAGAVPLPPARPSGSNVHDA